MWEGKYWKRQLCLLAGPRGSAGPQFYLRGTEGEQKEKEKHNLVWFITSLFLLMLQSPELFNDKPLYFLSNNTKLTVDLQGNKNEHTGWQLTFRPGSALISSFDQMHQKFSHTEE